MKSPNHTPFLNIWQAIHHGTFQRYTRLERMYRKLTDGGELDGGCRGIAYESIANAVARQLGINRTFMNAGATVDFLFGDYRVALQVKTNGGGKFKDIYQFGKTVSKVRGEAVEEARTKIVASFDEHPEMDNFYLSAFNFSDKVLDIYHLAQRDGRKIVIINDFLTAGAGRNPFNPNAKVGTELQFRTSTLKHIHRYP